MDYQELIEEVYQEVQEENLRGKVANYIPELATVDPHQFGIALVDLKGNVYGVGDFQMPFSIQSISKVHTLTMVFPKFDTQLWSRVNV
ncbi:MAG TPA: glutaminase, partial [Algoriphagus sp.]|nr:glutaminase [Algoriphagus sp.]